MYISYALPNKRISEFEMDDIELMWVEIMLGNKKIMVGTCYRPPGQTVEEVDIFMSNLQDSLSMVINRNPESIILMGDFNDTCMAWESEHTNSILKLKLYDCININDLHQMVHEPTHFGPFGSAKILDLLITDSPGYILALQSLPPLGSKHQVVKAEFKIQYRRDKPFTREIWNYKRGDYAGLLNELINAPWDVGINTFDDINDMANFWQHTFMDI